MINTIVKFGVDGVNTAKTGVFPYRKIFELDVMPENIQLDDYMNGFYDSSKNYILDHIQSKSHNKINITSAYKFDSAIKNQYPNLNFNFKLHTPLWSAFENYKMHPVIDYKNFICSFNGSAHVGRKLLVAILEKFKYFDSNYCSKNFSYSMDSLDGNIEDLVEDKIRFYRKFFITNNNDFFEKIHSFGYIPNDHKNNIYNLELKLTESFLHIVSETMSTSYYPFVTEKFLYSTVTRGLFLAYGQPGWHAHVEKYYGFKRYLNIFDYKFDTIQNPVERLVELVTMISKFSHLTPMDWHDLYLLEQDTIEYNYDHYFSKQYLECLNTYE